MLVSPPKIRVWVPKAVANVPNSGGSRCVIDPTEQTFLPTPPASSFMATETSSTGSPGRPLPYRKRSRTKLSVTWMPSTTTKHSPWLPSHGSIAPDITRPQGLARFTVFLPASPTLHRTRHDLAITDADLMSSLSSKLQIQPAH